MIMTIILCAFIGLVIATIANFLAWYAGKKRLDVLTFGYLPIAGLWYLVPLTLGLLLSIAELVANPRQRWRDTIGGRIAAGSASLFLAGWLGSVISGVVLRYFLAWPDGPTPPKP